MVLNIQRVNTVEKQAGDVDAYHWCLLGCLPLILFGMKLFIHSYITYKTNPMIILFTAVSSVMSLALSGTLSVVLFAGMQMFRQQLSSVEYLTVFGGLLGSFLFVLLLTVSF